MAPNNKITPKPTDEATPMVLTPEVLAAITAKVTADVEAKMQAKYEATEKAMTSDEIDASTERRFVQAERSLKQILKEGEQVEVTLPIDQLNPNEPVVVGLNGVFYSIPTGIEVKIPKPIYDIWKESYAKTMAAMKKIVVKELKEVEVQD